MTSSSPAGTRNRPGTANRPFATTPSSSRPHAGLAVTLIGSSGLYFVDGEVGDPGWCNAKYPSA